MIQQSIPAISATFLTALVSTYSVTAIAAYGVTGKLETILFYPVMALNMVLTTIIGQCVGGALYDRAKDYLKYALWYGCGLLVILSVFVVGFSKQLSGLFVRSDGVAAIVGTYFLSYLGFGLNGIWAAVLVSHVVASIAAGISGRISFKKQFFAVSYRRIFRQRSA